MDSSIDYGMDNDVYDDSQGSEQQTQSTQQASQPQSVTVDAHLWGYMQPCNASLTRIDFWKIHPKYTIGRNTELNQVILPGFKVSEYHTHATCTLNDLITSATQIQGNQHCTITWDGAQDDSSTAVVHDLSSNGTFVSVLCLLPNISLPDLNLL